MIKKGKTQDEVRAFLATQIPTVYANPNSSQSQKSLPGFMTELK